jgi:twitching motility two-component system response regulator PilH
MTAKSTERADEPASTPIQHQPNTSPHILVVEDDPNIRRLNTAVLANFGYQVDAAEDGAAAWKALQLDKYDLLITDHDMPKVTGVELLQKLHDTSMKLPVIMATGTLPEEQLARHPWLEIEAVLLKPYTLDELLDTVRNVLHMTAGNHQEIVPPPHWQGQPLPNGLRL